MAISYNTGTTSIVTNSGTAGGHTFTIPAGVLSGDVVLVLVTCFTTATGSLTVTLTSSATTPAAVGSQESTGINSGRCLRGGRVFQRVIPGHNDHTVRDNRGSWGLASSAPGRGAAQHG